MNDLTLGQFIQDEMKRREMSMREFAKLVGVSHKIIGKFRNHGINPIYNKRPVGEPSLEFLAKLSKATSIDLCALVALIYPDHTVADPRAAITNARISQLPPEKIEILDTFLKGLLFDHFDSGSNGGL
jgi:transcriptional regulator with XRE-family HTH domain